MIKYFLNYLFQTKIHLLLILYLFVGTLLFTISIPTDNYFLIIGNLFLQKTYLCIFLFPSCLLFGLYQYRLMSHHTQLMMHLKNRTHYLWIESLITFATIFLLLLEILLIATSLAIVIHGVNFDLKGIEFFAYQLIRLSCCVVVLQFIVTTLLIVFKKSIVAISIIFLFVFISFQNIPSTIQTIGNTILLTRYIFYYPIEISMLNWFGISLLYYTVILMICLIVQYFYVQRIDFIEER